MKKSILVTLICLVSSYTFAQTIYMTRSGQVSFFSKTPMENIDAINNEVTSMINSGTGEVVFAVLVKSFRFEKALMEEHFNENYMESTKFPKSTFQGKISNLDAIDFKKDGSYQATVEGELNMHGVKQHVSSIGTITIAKGKVAVISNITVKLADYKIERPSLVAEKISETIDIKINCQYEPKS
jgi:polyisoprenoid-binding protein YceI